MSGGAHEACIVAWEESLQDGIGLRQGVRLCEPKFTDEPILEGTPKPFDPTLRLRGVGGDPLDAQLAQSATDLGWRSGAALELLV